MKTFWQFVLEIESNKIVFTQEVKELIIKVLAKNNLNVTKMKELYYDRY